MGQVLGYASAATTWDVDRLESVASEYITRRKESGHADIVEYLTNQLGSEESALSLLEDAAERLALGDVTALVVVDTPMHRLSFSHSRSKSFYGAGADFSEPRLQMIEAFHADPGPVICGDPGISGDVGY